MCRSCFHRETFTMNSQSLSLSPSAKKKSKKCALRQMTLIFVWCVSVCLCLFISFSIPIPPNAAFSIYTIFGRMLRVQSISSFFFFHLVCRSFKTLLLIERNTCVASLIGEKKFYTLFILAVFTLFLLLSFIRVSKSKCTDKYTHTQ